MTSLRTDRWLRGMVAALSVLLVMVVHGAIREHVVNAGDHAPRFSFHADNGQVITEKAFGGRLLVLNFWATWCPTCVAEMPSLAGLAERLRAEGVVVAAVSMDRNEEAYRRFVKQLPGGLVTAREEEGALPAMFGTFRVPETYVIDSHGRVLRKYISYRDWTNPELVAEIRGLLRTE